MRSFREETCAIYVIKRRTINYIFVPVKAFKTRSPPADVPKFNFMDYSMEYYLFINFITHDMVSSNKKGVVL